MKCKLYLKAITLVCLLAMFLCGCSDGNQEPIGVLVDDFRNYDEQELIDISDVIIVGTVIKTETIYDKKNDEDGRLKKGTPTQYSHIRVSRTLRGPVPKNGKIIFPLWGDGKTFSVDNTMTVGGYFEKGDRVLLFLSEKSEEAWDSIKEHNPKLYRKTKKFKEPLRIPINYYQSIYRIDEEGNILHERNKSNISLFTDCATVDELAEKYGLN